MADIEAGYEIDLLTLFNEGDGARTLVMTGTNDPSTGAGELAPVGALFLRQVTAVLGEVYYKQGPTDVDWVLIASDQNIQEIQDIFTDMREPTGHVDQSESKISFVEGTRTFTIEPNAPATEFNYYIHGVKYTITIAKNAIIPDVQGIHFIYFDTNENLLITSGTFDGAILHDYAYTAAVYWDVGTQTATYFGEERHGITMDGFTHSHFHLAIGTQYIRGLALNSLNPDVGAPVDTDTWCGVDNGLIRDEDIDINIIHSVTGADDTTVDFEQILVAPAQIPVLYRDGPAGNWLAKTADDYSIIYSGSAGYTDVTNGLPAWNEWTGATWQLTPVANNHFVLTHIIATNDRRYPIIALQGVTDYTNKPQGLDAAKEELAVMTGLPFQEMTPIATLIWECRNTYTNTVKARLRTTDTGDDYVDWRDIETFSSTIGGGGITYHSNLGGLGNDDHLQYVYTQGTERPIVEINAVPADGDVLTYDLANGWWEAATPVAGQDELVKVSANDTTAGYLNGKLVAGTGITLTENNDGANETFTISASAVGTTHLSRHNGGVTQTFDVVPTTILFNTNVRTDADFSYAAGVTTINTTAWYKITFDVSYDNNGNQQVESETWVEVNGTPVAGSYAYGYHRAVGTGLQTQSSTILLNLTATDTVEVVTQRFAGTNTLSTIAESCRLNMTKLG